VFLLQGIGREQSSCLSLSLCTKDRDIYPPEGRVNFHRGTGRHMSEDGMFSLQEPHEAQGPELGEHPIVKATEMII
jgi:hypothetical protein